MLTTTEHISPELARKYLANQAQNRGVSNAHVQNFEVAILKGEFHLSPQGIAFDRQGRLRDGQHRLIAVAAGTITVSFRVHRDCSEEELEVLDHGRPRSVADGLRIYKADKFAHNKVAAVRLAASIGCGSNVRVNSVVYHTLADALGVDNVATICEIPRGVVSAPGLLSLVYARPITPKGCAELLLNKLRMRETVLTHAEAALFGDGRTAARNRVIESIVGILGDKLCFHRAPRDAAYRIMRGVQAFVEGEPIRSLKVSLVGYDWITERRERIGLPSLSDIVPPSLRRSSRSPRGDAQLTSL